MKIVWIACAALLLGTVTMGPANAEDTKASATPQVQSPNADSAGSPGAAELSGQLIYNQRDEAVGTVSSVITDAQGQPRAVVGVEKFLGMGVKNLLIPVSSLQPRSAGGYTTSLSADDIRNLSEAKTDTR
jgi:hypothetical protein